MEEVLIDQYPVNPRKGVVVNNSSSNGRFMKRSHKSFSSSYSSVSQLFLNLNAGTGSSTVSFGLFGSRPSPPRHSSLPCFLAAPSMVAPSMVAPSMVAPPPPFPPRHQPPLLPLPFSRSATLPSPTPTKRIAAAVTTVRSRDHRKKTRPAANPPRKEARLPATAAAPSDPSKGGESMSVVPQKPAQKSAAPPEAAEWEEGEEEREEGFLMESVYLLSPPPSSLPLPTFFLKRPKAAPSAASCIAEAMGCGGRGGGGANSGATDDLRRLLRL